MWSDHSCDVEHNTLKIEVCLLESRESILVEVSKSTLISKVLRTAYAKFGIAYGSLMAIVNGSAVYGGMNMTIGELEMEDGDEIVLMKDQVGGKPVIYLHSPTAIDASVKLRLIPEWHFSAVYPVVPTKRDFGERIEWNVSTHEDGSLTENNTGLDVSYLFWEAE